MRVIKIIFINIFILVTIFSNFIYAKDIKNFQWGVSISGYQHEGYDKNSIWYYWDKLGKTKEKNTIGVDFYNRYKEDLDLAASIGINAFRFSIEWSRIEPQKGIFDSDAIDYYRKLILEIKKRGMEPLVTLIHFNYPQWLLDEDSNLKGLENPKFINYYLRYVKKVVKEYSNDVKYWITFNEPNIWVPASYLLGIMPPGKMNIISTIKAWNNLLEAHYKSYDIIHKIDNDAMVSSNIYYIMVKPFNIDLKEIFTFIEKANINDIDWLKKFDFVSFDYYYLFKDIKDFLNTQNFWELNVYPDGLYEAIMYYNSKYGKPIIIAENGLCLKNNLPRGDFWTREKYLVEHIKQVKKSIKDGANVIGYYYWSLTDSYEWGNFDPRFGLYTVDIKSDYSLKRKPTKAVDTYRSIISSNFLGS